MILGAIHIHRKQINNVILSLNNNDVGVKTSYVGVKISKITGQKLTFNVFVFP